MTVWKIGLVVVGVVAVAALGLTYAHANLSTQEGAHSNEASKRKLF